MDEALETPHAGRILRSSVDVKKIRQNLNLSQREFSNRYHIKLDTKRNWEQNRRIPDLTSIAFLTCIQKNAVVIDQLLNS